MYKREKREYELGNRYLHQHSLATGRQVAIVGVLRGDLVVLDLLQLLVVGLVCLLLVLCNDLRDVGVVSGGNVVRCASVEGPVNKTVLATPNRKRIPCIYARLDVIFLRSKYYVFHGAVVYGV